MELIVFFRFPNHNCIFILLYESLKQFLKAQVGCWVIKINDHFASGKAAQQLCIDIPISATEDDDIKADSLELLETWRLWMYLSFSLVLITAV